MSYSLDDTIAAVATAPGGAARGIVRVSGPDAVECVARCFTPDDGQPLAAIKGPSVIPGHLRLPHPDSSFIIHHSSFDSATPPSDGARMELPCVLYLWPGTRSYTRAPVAELHTLGSPPLLEAALRTVCAAGARLAQPGEFTLRAFLAGRIDLTQAEAVLGVIDATDQRALQIALAQLAGGLAEPLHRLRGEMLDLLAEVEAGLDFVEEDIQFITNAELSSRVERCLDSVAQVLAQVSARSEASETARVALVGCPNVGKSSLLNAVAGRPATLVSAQPGTTRDYLTARLTFNGQSVELVDTAGVEEDGSESSLRSAAQQMTTAARSNAQLQLLCLDATRPHNDWERAELSQPNANRWVVWTKIDACPENSSPSGRGQGEGAADVPGWGRGTGAASPHPNPLPEGEGAILTSSLTGQGIDPLREKLAEWLAQRGSGGAVAGTVARSRESLRLAQAHLEQALDVTAAGGGEELVAAELRGALLQLGQVAGAVYTDDVLDRIFSRFCIGK